MKNSCHYCIHMPRFFEISKTIKINCMKANKNRKSAENQKKESVRWNMVEHLLFPQRPGAKSSTVKETCAVLTEIIEDFDKGKFAELNFLDGHLVAHNFIMASELNHYFDKRAKGDYSFIPSLFFEN